MKFLNHFIANNYMTEWKTWFDGLNNPMVTTALSNSNNTLNITIDNLVTVNITRRTANTSWIDNVTVTYDGSTTSKIASFEWNQKITICSGENTIYFQIQDGSASATGRRFAFLYEKVGDTKLYGYSGSTTAVSFYDISGILLTSIAPTAGATFIHGTTITYNANVGMIDYINSDFLFSNGVHTVTDSNFMACTTVPVNQIITFNGKNYYSIGAHTLAPID